jgi:folate-binding protein YgfZ
MNAIFSISGPDAKKFLQGQLTCDLEMIKENEWRLGAHCNPKGRVISLFNITLLNDAYYLRLPAEMLTTAMDALKKYAVFFKAKITEVTDTPTLPIDTDTKRDKIRKGIPDVYLATTGKYLPHELNLHQLGAVSLTKGCYTGQEIIARMHYLGKLKTHLYRATINKQNLHPGQDIQAIASIVDASALEDGTSVALILTDDVTAKAGQLHIDHQPIIFELDSLNGTLA